MLEAPAFGGVCCSPERWARPRAGVALLAGALLCLTFSPSARAEPQWNSALRAGVAGAGTRASPWQQTKFYGALYGDVLFGRSSSNDLGLGPFIDLGTLGFSDLRLSAGPSLLLPVASYVTQWSIGAYVVPTSPTGQGLHTQIFFGGRGYNYHSRYSPALGFVVGLDYGLGARHDVALTAGASIDLEYLAIPFIVLHGLLQSSD